MSNTRETLTIGIPMYGGMDPLDVAAPYEVFCNAAQSVADRCDLRVFLMAETHVPVTSRFGMTLYPHRAFYEVDALDVLWVPGGDPGALKVLMQGGAYLDSLKKWSRNARVVSSVCEGAMLLAAAGLLDGYKATTHWAFYRCLEAYHRIKVVQPTDGLYPRFVLDPAKPRRGARGIRLTGGGISSGLDESLRLVELLFGPDVAKDVQVTIQYFPEPPVKGAIPAVPDCPLQPPPNPKNGSLPA